MFGILKSDTQVDKLVEAQKSLRKHSEDYAELNRTKAEITKQEKAAKEAIEKIMQEHGESILGGKTKLEVSEGVHVGYGKKTELVFDADKYDEAKFIKEFPFATKVSISTSTITTLETSEKEAEKLKKHGVSTRKVDILKIDVK